MESDRVGQVGTLEKKPERERDEGGWKKWD